MENNGVQTVVSVFLDRKKLLMCQRSPSKRVYTGFLVCPSDHIEKGESLEQAIARERQEELGIAVKKSKSCSQ